MIWRFCMYLALFCTIPSAIIYLVATWGYRGKKEALEDFYELKSIIKEIYGSL